MVLTILKLIQKIHEKNLELIVRRAKAGRIVSLTGFRRKLHVGFCLTFLTSIDDINFTDLILKNPYFIYLCRYK